MSVFLSLKLCSKLIFPADSQREEERYSDVKYSECRLFCFSAETSDPFDHSNAQRKPVRFDHWLTSGLLAVGLAG